MTQHERENNWKSNGRWDIIWGLYTGDCDVMNFSEPILVA